MANKNKTISEKNNAGVIAVIIVSVIILLACILPPFTFVRNFLLGVFGIFSYILFAGALFFGITRYFNIPIKVSKKKAALLVAIFFLLLAVAQMVFDWKLLTGNTLSEYVAAVYAKKWTAGGIFAGIALLVRPVTSAVGPAAALIVYILAIIILTLAALEFKWPARAVKEVPAPVPEFKEEIPEQPKLVLPITETQPAVSARSAFKSSGSGLYVADIAPRGAAGPMAFSDIGSPPPAPVRPPEDVRTQPLKQYNYTPAAPQGYALPEEVYSGGDKKSSARSLLFGNKNKADGGEQYNPSGFQGYSGYTISSSGYAVPQNAAGNTGGPSLFSPSAPAKIIHESPAPIGRVSRGPLSPAKDEFLITPPPRGDFSRLIADNPNPIVNGESFSRYIEGEKFEERKSERGITDRKPDTAQKTEPIMNVSAAAPDTARFTSRRVEPHASILSSLRPDRVEPPLEIAPVRKFSEADGTFRSGLNSANYKPYVFEPEPKRHNAEPAYTDDGAEAEADEDALDFFTGGGTDEEDPFDERELLKDAEEPAFNEKPAMTAFDKSTFDKPVESQPIDRKPNVPENRVPDSLFGIKEEPPAVKKANEPETAADEIEPLYNFSGSGNDFSGYYETLKPDSAPRAEFEDKVRRIDAALTGMPEIKPEPPAEPRQKISAKSKLKPENQFGIDDYAADAGNAERVKPLLQPVKYTPPPFDLLMTASDDHSDDGDTRLKQDIIESTLEEFKVPAKVINVTRGPAVTRFELQMPPGISVKKIEPFEQDLSYRLASTHGVRIETPIPGKTAVGIEVPNKNISIVGLREILESKEFTTSNSPLTFALGKDIGGDKIVCNLAKMPHLLIAGATGSGKSACLNSLIASMIYKTSPDDLRLILIDPKRVEFSNFNGLPHLMLPDVVTELDKAINAFNWAINEMERRYHLFNSLRVRNIGDYNVCDAVKSGEQSKIPYIVIIVDELADMMMQAKREVEDRIRNLAQKARAAGIHLVLATQRPSVDVITGTIKANLPSRIAFAVTNFADSKTILDGGGADKLLGRGDMLYSPLDAPEPKRIQGAYVTAEEVNAILEYVRENNPSVYDDSVSNMINTVKKLDDNDEDGADIEAEADNDDPFLGEAVKLVIENGQASISMVQRRFCVGYARAARLIDQMELRKYISPFEGSKPRQVYINMDDWRNIFGS